MPRKKPAPNIWQQFPRAPYDRFFASYVLYGEYDVEHQYVEVIGYDADGNQIGEWQTEPVTNPILVKWIDALMAFDKRGNKHPLIALLDSDVETLPIVKIWLADLVWRHNILTDGIEDYIAQRWQLADLLREFVLPPPKRGPSKGAAYDMPDHIAGLYLDTAHREKHGGSVGDAIAAIVSEKYPRDPAARAPYIVKLQNFRDGRNVFARRAAKRRI
jgi:hypothetical protein